MTYGLLLAFVLFCSGVASARNPAQLPRLGWVLAAAVALVLASGLRYGTGTDTWTYAGWYSQVLPYQPLTAGKDPGFTLLCKGIQLAVGTDPTWMFLIVSVLTVVPVVLVLRKHARLFALGMALHVLAGVYFYGFNGVRQALAGAIVFAASDSLFEGRWRTFMPVVALAALVHATALAFIPVYLLVNPSIGAPVKVALAAMLMMVLVNIDESSTLLASAVGSTRFDAYSETMAIQEAGANILRVLVRLAVFIVAFAYRRRLARALPGQGVVLVNLTLVSLGLYLLSGFHLIYARLAYYPAMYEMLVLPAVVDLFSPASRRAVALLVFACFLTYSAALLLGGESHLLPYRSVLE